MTDNPPSLSCDNNKPKTTETLPSNPSEITRLENISITFLDNVLNCCFIKQATATDKQPQSQKQKKNPVATTLKQAKTQSKITAATLRTPNKTSYSNTKGIDGNPSIIAYSRNYKEASAVKLTPTSNENNISNSNYSATKLYSTLSYYKPNSEAIELYKESAEISKQKKLYAERLNIIKITIDNLKKREELLTTRNKLLTKQETKRIHIKEEKEELRNTILSKTIDYEQGWKKKKEKIWKHKTEIQKKIKEAQDKAIKVKRNMYIRNKNEGQVIDRLLTERNTKLEETNHEKFVRIREEHNRYKSLRDLDWLTKEEKSKGVIQKKVKSDKEEIERLKSQYAELEKQLDETRKNIKKKVNAEEEDEEITFWTPKEKVNEIMERRKKMEMEKEEKTKKEKEAKLEERKRAKAKKQIQMIYNQYWDQRINSGANSKNSVGTGSTEFRIKVNTKSNNKSVSNFNKNNNAGKGDSAGDGWKANEIKLNTKQQNGNGNEEVHRDIRLGQVNVKEDKLKSEDEEKNNDEEYQLEGKRINSVESEITSA